MRRLLVDTRDRLQDTPNGVLDCIWLLKSIMSKHKAHVQRWTHLVSSTMGSFNRDHFLSFLKHLQPKLGPDTVILMDNVRFHHSQCIKSYIAAQGWECLYMPPYSPWYNPIEGCFSIVKRHYAITQNITESFSALTQQHAAAFYRHSLQMGPVFGLNK
jgi:transposase